MSVESELEIKIAAMDPAQFERLVADVVRDENPGANRVSPPDGGADMVVLADEGQPARVWQAKHFTGRPNWANCEQSLRTAIATYQPQSVTFVFSRDLTGPQVKTFEDRLRKSGAEAGLAVDYWELGALRDRLQRNPHLRVRYFRYDEQTLLDIHAAQAGHEGPLAALRHLDEFFGVDDPAFEYEVEVLRHAALPEPAMIEGASATLILRDGPRTVRAAVNPREAGAGPNVVWNFAETERGNAAREEAMLSAARGDQDVVVDSAGLALELRNAPKLLCQEFEQTPREQLLGRLVFQPGPGIDMTVVAHGASGRSASRSLTLYPFPPAPWQPFGAHDRAFVGLDGALMVHIAIRFENPDGTRSQVAFVPGLDLGCSARENVSALWFWRALQEAGRVELIWRAFCQGGRHESPAFAGRD